VFTIVQHVKSNLWLLGSFVFGALTQLKDVHLPLVNALKITSALPIPSFDALLHRLLFLLNALIIALTMESVLTSLNAVQSKEKNKKMDMFTHVVQTSIAPMLPVSVLVSPTTEDLTVLSSLEFLYCHLSQQESSLLSLLLF
jgi:hypothetical protein